ncbi:DUF721 domain-containing protein [Patescibacteria group bacterium]|nr:DUF721 domain-containing protein [Patescibacteria group bacterium]
MWEPLGNLIPKIIKKAGIAQQISDALICEEFDKIARNILGQASKHCRAIYVKDHVLWVASLSGSASNELKMREQDILRALADKFGADKVVQLRFIV